MTTAIRGALLMMVLVAVAASPRASAEPVPTLSLTSPELLAQAEGLAVERQHWRLGDSAGWVWRARIPVPAVLQVVAASEVRRLQHFLPADPGPWAIINGGFYDLDGKAMGLVVADGEMVAPLRRGGGSGILEVRQRRARIVHWSEYRPGATQALQSTDRIVAAGRSLVSRQWRARRAARAVAALSERYLWFLLLAGLEQPVARSGRMTLFGGAARGVPVWAAADYVLMATDAKDALNLDGSVSAQLAVKVGRFELRIQGMGGTINALLMRPSP